MPLKIAGNFRAHTRAALCVGALLIAGCQTAPVGEEAAIQESLYQAAQTAEQTFDYETAINHYNKLAQQNPDSPQLQIALARNLRYSGASQKAVRVLESMGSAKDGNLGYTLELAKAKIGHGKAREAIDLLNAAAPENADNWEIYATLGIAHDLEEDFKSALSAYQKARKLSGDNPAILNNMALSLALSGDVEGAISLLQSAPRLARHSPQIRQNLALFYGIKGDTTAAEALARMDLDEESVQSNLSIYAQLRKK